MDNAKRIGLLVGQEWSFPPAFLEEVNSRDAGVLAEYVVLGGVGLDQPLGYDVIIDRISHQVAYYRTVLKHAALQGSYVINDPFRWSADDRFVQASLAASLDVPTPRTVILPTKSYREGIVGESLRNLSYPLDWDGLAASVGWPAILKEVGDPGSGQIFRVNSVDELLHVYDTTGEKRMMLQEYIEAESFVHCFCIGPDQALVVPYDPVERRYRVDDELAGQAELHTQIIDCARRLNRALGYDVNRIEFAVRDGIPYAIDIMNPAPDIDINAMTPRHFDWMVQALADFSIAMALEPRKSDA